MKFLGTNHKWWQSFVLVNKYRRIYEVSDGVVHFFLKSPSKTPDKVISYV